jgi:hypothetical protein
MNAASLGCPPKKHGGLSCIYHLLS